MITIDKIEHVSQQEDPSGAATAAVRLCVEVPIEGDADGQTCDDSGRCIAILTTDKSPAEVAEVLAAVKVRQAAGQGALASHLDALGWRDALEALAARS